MGRNNKFSDLENVSILSEYCTVARKLALLPPMWINGFFNDEEEERETPIIVKVFFALVIGLAMASVANIGTRAYHYHANILSYVTGACLALVVPASVFVAAHMKGLTSQGRRYAWTVAGIAALLSSFIQIKMYMTESNLTIATILSGNIDLEAISFSAGIPFFDVLIASLSAMISDAHNREVERLKKDEDERLIAEKRKIEEEEKRLKVEEDERIAREHKLKLDMKRAEIDLELMEREREQNIAIAAEASREKALSEIRIKEQKAAAKVSAKVSKKVSISEDDGSLQVVNNKKRTVENNPKTVDPNYQKKQLVYFFKDNPGALFEEAGNHINASKGTVSKLVDELLTLEVLHAEKQGRRKIVTVNGGSDAFLNS